MDLFRCIWMVFVCTWWLGVSADGMGRKVLSDMNEASPVLFEMSFWDVIIYIWAIWVLRPYDEYKFIGVITKGLLFNPR